MGASFVYSMRMNRTHIKIIIAVSATLLFIELILLGHLHKSSPAVISLERPAKPQADSEPRWMTKRPAVSPSAPQPKTNLYARLKQNGFSTIAAERLSEYLEKNHRNAASLLAASRVTGDRAFLREAMENFPDDPRVALEAYCMGSSDSPNPAETRHKWIERLKKSDSDNSLGNYLSVGGYLKGGQIELALQEIKSATGKANYNDYSLDFLENAEEAYHAAGESENEAKVSATYSLVLPTLSDFKETGRALTDLAGQYQASGDTMSAQAILQMTYEMAERLNGPGQFPLINTLTGISMEKTILSAMDPNAIFENSGLTVQQKLDSLNLHRTDIQDLKGKSEPLIESASDSDLINFNNRAEMFGEEAARRWIIEQYGEE
jgi:hypothetical protein